MIPDVHTCDGDNTSPALAWEDAPEGMESFVLIMTDPDIPDTVKESRGITMFDHWVVFNIPPEVTSIEAGSEPIGVPGLNSNGETGYKGPCPPDREHRYFFRLCALDTMLDLAAGASREEVEKAMEGHIIDEATLIGRYERVTTRG